MDILYSQETPPHPSLSPAQRGGEGQGEGAAAWIGAQFIARQDAINRAPTSSFRQTEEG